MKIRACPFCGGKAITTVNTYGHYSVFCENDECFMNFNQMLCTTEEEAIKAWNRRDANESIAAKEIRDKVIEEFVEKLGKVSELVRPVGWCTKQEIVLFRSIKEIAEQMKEVGE